MAEHSGADPGRRFATAMMRFERQRHVITQCATIGTANLRLLCLLSESGPRTLREIADQLKLEQSTVNRQVNAALHQGMVERSREPGSPAYRFAPTEAGTEALKANLDVILGGYQSALDRLGPEKSERLIALLHEFADEYGRVVDER